MRPKTLFILHLPPPIHGAAVVGLLIKNSERINNQMNASYLNLSTSVAVDDIGKGGFGKIFRFIKLFSNVFIKTLRFRPKLVYVTMSSKGTGFYKDAILVLLLKLLGRNLVFHFHNKGIKDYENKWFDNKLYHLVFRKSNVILLSERLKTDVAKYVNEDKIHYCPNGLKPVNEEELKSEKENSVKRILFIGNLAVSKGVFDLLDALKILKDRGVEVECNIIGGEGSISSQELLQSINEKGLQLHVNYLGKVIGTEKDNYLKTSNFLVHPAHEECFPLVLLEAMNFALPVISTIEGGIPDIVNHGETGFLIEKHNIADLADRIYELISNDSLCELMGKNGRKRFLENFTVESFENRFCRIIQHITK